MDRPKGDAAPIEDHERGSKSDKHRVPPSPPIVAPGRPQDGVKPTPMDGGSSQEERKGWLPGRTECIKADSDWHKPPTKILPVTAPVTAPVNAPVTAPSVSPSSSAAVRPVDECWPPYFYMANMYPETVAYQRCNGYGHSSAYPVGGYAEKSIGNVRLKVVKGNIAAQDTDAIGINSTIFKSRHISERSKQRTVLRGRSGGRHKRRWRLVPNQYHII